MKLLKSLTLACSAFGASIFCASSAQGAGLIVSPVSASASSTFSVDFSIDNTINQSGLSNGFVSGVDDFDAYIATNPTHTAFAVDEWFTEEGITNATVDYDLGSSYLIDRFALWNEESSGIGSFNLLTSTDGVNFSANIVDSPIDSPLGLDYPVEVFGLTTVLARFVRLEVNGCPQEPSGFSACAIGEVAFSTSTVPEPLTLLGASAAIAFGAAFKHRKA